MTEYKNLYDKLLKDGDLFDLMPEAKGNWEEDKRGFIEIQDELEYDSDTFLFLDEEEQEDYFFED